MKYVIGIGLLIATVLGVNVSYKMDETTFQTILQAWDVSCAVNNEMRINIPAQYDNYYITYLSAYHSTAGTEAATDDTEIQVKDITNNIVLDTIVIEPTVLSGAQRDATVSYQVDTGDEISFKVIEVTDTPGKGLRVIIKLDDLDAVN